MTVVRIAYMRSEVASTLLMFSEVKLLTLRRM